MPLHRKVIRHPLLDPWGDGVGGLDEEGCFSIGMG